MGDVVPRDPLRPESGQGAALGAPCPCGAVERDTEGRGIRCRLSTGPGQLGTQVPKQRPEQRGLSESQHLHSQG